MSQDLKLIGELYSQMYSKPEVVEEGLGKTLGAVALGVMGILGAKSSIEKSGEEYSKGLPSLQAPDEGAAKSKLDSYLNKVGMLKVKADPKHIEALNYISKNSPDPEIQQRAQFILSKQSRLP